MNNSKILLPKSTKNIHYEIFKNINIIDVIVFSFFLLLSTVLSLTIKMSGITRFTLGSIVIILGIISIQKINNNLRLYSLFFRILKYFVIGFKRPEITVQPISIQKEEILIQQLKKKSLFIGGIKIQATNLSLLNQKEKEKIINDFSVLLKTITLPFKIIKIDKNYCFDKQINNLNQDIKNNNKNISQALINLQIGQLQTIQNSKELKIPAIYILFQSDNKKETILQLENLKNTNFLEKKLKVSTLNCKEIASIWKKFSFNQETLKPLSSKIKSKNKSGFIWSLNNLPRQINFFWLQQLFNLNNVNICINGNTIQKEQAKKTLDNAISKIETNAKYYATKTSEELNAKQYHAAFLSQQQAIIDDTDVLKEISIFIICYGDKKELGECKQELTNLANINGWKYDRLNFLQTQAILACYYWLNMINKITSIEMTCNIFATSFPFSESLLKDDNGFLLAETISRKPVIWDLFANTKERINKNILILGESGSGKSFTAKKILSNLSYKETKIFILDPEKEYSLLTKNLDGQIINAAGAKKEILNPLQIYKIDSEKDNIDTFKDHISLLETFFILLFPKLKEEDQLLVLLIQIIQDTYKSKKIYSDSDFFALKNKDFPTFDDTYKLILEKIENSTSNKELLQLEDLKSKLTSLTQGTYSKYWNGHTKLNWKSNFTCFDLQELVSNSNQKIINIQMLLLLRLLSQELIANKIINEKENKNQKIAIVVDEAHLLINENNIFALDFLFHTAKRIRKYNGSLIIISQNINDFTGSEAIKKKFTGIINNSQYWLIGGMQPNDLNALNQMYQESQGLSKAVKAFIGSASKGKFWFKISKQEQLAINILQLPVENELIERH